jgi:hypothetical protein
MKQGIATIGFGAAAAVTAYAVHHWVANDVETLTSLLFALVPFVLATEAVARVPRAWASARWMAPLMVSLVFLAVMGGFAPLMFGAFVDEDFDRFYSIMRMLVPFVILALVFALRLGGAAGATVRRASYAALLVMLSGIEDLMFQVWRGNEIPDKWEWAEHITVRLGGHVASQNEAFAFIAAHFVLAAVVIFAPVPGRRSKVQPSTDEAPADDRAPTSVPS